MKATFSHQIKNLLMHLPNMEVLGSLCNVMLHGSGNQPFPVAWMPKEEVKPLREMESGIL